MDTICDEARLDPFRIGPSSLIGRTVALRVLLCKSISHFRRRLALFLRRILRFVLPAVSWFHPRNTHGILAAVTLMFILLRRGTHVRSRAESAYRRKFWRNMMRAALSYEEWAHAARMLDRENAERGAIESDLYDEELVRNKLQELRQRREEGSLRDIVFCMRADLFRNLGNMCSPQLHKGRLQVPKLIKEYIDEVTTQLKMVCNSDDSEDLLFEEKLAFMHETRHSFGRTALLLSGGASLGAFHVGVVKTLVQQKLVPRIVAGSSVGSIVCAILATRTWPELESFFEDSWHQLQFFDQMGGIFTVVKRVMTHGAVHEIRQLQRLLRHLTSNLTFQEAYDVTGRILGITVCSPRKHEPPRCLNYLTSPHVVIWSAVTASCAFPGLFEAQELMAKDRFGEIVPFHAPFLGGPEQPSGNSTRRWRDGSLESDLPMMQLKELFNVNHFIVSQANPHIAPVLRVKELIRAYGGNFAAKLAHIAEMEIKHRCNQILELGFPLGGLAKLFAQEWEGDVTIVMPATLAQYSKIIQNPSYPELQKAVNQGRRCTWEKLSAIKANCAIELALDECVALLNHTRRLKRSAERAAASHGHASSVKFSVSGRIPSWNCIARNNSSCSLDEEGPVDTSASNQKSTSHGGGLLRRGDRCSQCSIHDMSDNESESTDLNSWTRSGGPLMRTASANRFINFVQNLDIDPDFRSSPMDDEADGAPALSNMTGTQPGRRKCCHDSSGGSTEKGSVNSSPDSREPTDRFLASTRILVTEGDLLQPERIHNGIVLSIVRRDSLIFAHTSSDFEQQERSPTEADVEVFQIENGDASSSSDYGDNDGCDTNCSSFVSDHHAVDSGTVHEVMDKHI